MARQALGRGLSALFGDAPQQPGEALVEVALDAVAPAGNQPRKDFPEESLAELAASIKANGIIQPIVVRRSGEGSYEIVAGERRWRAARLAGLHSIPAVVREVAVERMLELALIENLQREDLNPVDRAVAYETLIRERGLTQEEVAERVSKDRASVANTLRLLKLPEDVLEQVRAGRLSMGHARALLGLDDTESIRRLARRTQADALSVRQVEQLVRGGTTRPPARRKAPASKASAGDVHDKAAERRLSSELATKVEIQRRKKGGVVAITFYSEEDLMRLFDRLLEKEKEKT